MVASVSEFRGSVVVDAEASCDRLGGGGTGFRRLGIVSTEDLLSTVDATDFRLGS
jgi:hypothetical protein